MLNYGKPFQDFSFLGRLSLWGVILFGVILRITNVNSNFLFFYDEGYYLNFNYPLLNIIDQHPPKDFQSFWGAFNAVLKASLGTGKALWFLIVDSRALWGGLNFFIFPKIVSTVAGLLTLPVVYIFTKRVLNSKGIALLSTALLAVLPSHVFYSRLAMQEALSTLFFLLALYFYMFPREFGYRTFISSILFVCVFFTNYRLIIAPLLVGASEFMLSRQYRSTVNARKYIWHTLTFLSLIFLIGSMDKGQNLKTTFSWIFHQANLGKSQFDPVNFLSYPYYFFRLESFLFGLLFWANLYFIYQRDWRKSFSFMLVCCIMALFSFAADKASRYLCIGLPFAVAAVSMIIAQFYYEQKRVMVKRALIILVALTLLSLTYRSSLINQFRSAYRVVVNKLRETTPGARFISSQPWVQKLYVKDRGDVQELPHTFELLAQRYQQGFDYIILDPQVFVSYTESKEKFTYPLEGYLDFLVKYVKPVKVSRHFDQFLLERFVFEHSENLRTSVRFLNSKSRDLGFMFVYDLKSAVEEMRRVLSHQKIKAQD